MTAVNKSLQSIEVDGHAQQVHCYESADLFTRVFIDVELEKHAVADKQRSSDLGRLALPEDIFTLVRLLPNDEVLREVVLLPEDNSSASVTCEIDLYRFVCRGARWTPDLQRALSQTWCALARQCTPFESALYDLCQAIEGGKETEFQHQRSSIEIDFANEVCQYFLSADYVQMEPFLSSNPLKGMAVVASLKRIVERLSRQLPRQTNLLAVLRAAESQQQALFNATAISLFDSASPARKAMLAKTLVYAGAESTLERLKEIDSLSFSGEPFDDLLLRKLKFLPALTKVDLSHTVITTEGAAQLRWLTQLQELNLTGTRLHDAAMTAISRCGSLTRLNLADTPVGDAGLRQLAVLKRLLHLNLQHTNVSDDGRAELKKLLPFCRIVS